MRVLGIDLGSKRIGIATSDRSGLIATPLTVLQRCGSMGGDHRNIAKMVVEEEALAVVVGLPLNMDGSEGSAAKAARVEAAQPHPRLDERHGVPGALAPQLDQRAVELVDEAVDGVHHSADGAHLDLDVGEHQFGVTCRVLEEGQQIAAQSPAFDDLDRRCAQPVVEGRFGA